MIEFSNAIKVYSEVEIELLLQLLSADDTRGTFIKKLYDLEYGNEEVTAEFKKVVEGMAKKMNNLKDDEFEKLKNNLI